MQHILNSIRRVYPMGDEALQALANSLTERYVPRNTYLVHARSTGREVYFIEEGLTRSIFHYDGKETTTWFSREGDITFGMDSLYYNHPSIESIETLEDCRLYVMSVERLNELYTQYIDIANWGRVLHQNVNKELSHLFVDRLQLPPKARYERFLERYPGLANRVKLKYIAAFLGISIYTLSRIRAQIE